jgi:hypothetical protein
VYRRFVWRRFVEETFCRGDVLYVRQFRTFQYTGDVPDIYFARNFMKFYLFLFGRLSGYVQYLSGIWLIIRKDKSSMR